MEWKEKKYDKYKESILVKNGMHRMTARLLSQRDINTEKCSDFVSGQYKNLSHPYKLHDVEKSVKIFLDVAKNKGKISIIGDYDADGIISSTMLKELCNNFNLECEVFLPSRLEHGYGLNEKTIKTFLDKTNTIPDLLIVTDCGSNNYKEIEMLKKSGVSKIIIIDHHTIDKSLLSTNADGLISWHLTEGFNEMCACGQVFHFIRGIRWMTKKVSPIEFLTYAAIGTISDVSPLIGDNRIVVRNGLTEYAINHIIGVGFNSLLNHSKIHPSALTQSDVSFKIAPRINAVGRLSDPNIVHQFLIERDVGQANGLAEFICDYNDKRKQIQEEIEKKIDKKINNEMSHGILVYDESFHIGVVGIVASRIVDRYKKPVIVIGFHNGEWKGSGRSIGGIDIKQLADDCSHIFSKYGGHQSAIGVTLNNDYLKNAHKIFNSVCEKHIESIGDNVDKQFDAVINPKSISIEIANVILRDIYPYTSDLNEEPIFKLNNVLVSDTNFIEKDNWSLIKFRANRKDYQIPYDFQLFSPPFGSEIDGRTVNLIFKFPQKINDPINQYYQFHLELIDVEFLD